MGTLFASATEVAVVGDTVVVSLGEWTPWRGDPAFDAVLDIAARAEPRWIVVDLSGIAPPPWLLLRLLRLSRALHQDRDGGVLLVAVSVACLRRLERTGVSLLFRTFPSMEAALDWTGAER
jgi:anti-anti-sigma regulatory factor